jgi:hypothetical protein
MLTKTDGVLMTAAMAALHGKSVLIVVPNLFEAKEQAHRFHELMELASVGADMCPYSLFSYSALTRTIRFPRTPGRIFFHVAKAYNMMVLAGLRFDLVFDENRALTPAEMTRLRTHPIH